MFSVGSNIYIYIYIYIIYLSMVSKTPSFLAVPWIKNVKELFVGCVTPPRTEPKLNSPGFKGNHPVQGPQILGGLSLRTGHTVTGFL